MACVGMRFVHDSLCHYAVVNGQGVVTQCVIQPISDVFGEVGNAKVFYGFIGLLYGFGKFLNAFGIKGLCAETSVD